MNAERAHRRALADVNGDATHPFRDLAALALFVIGVILAVAVLSGHVAVSVR